MLGFGLVWLFFTSLNAWIDGDDSMSWYVIGVVVFLVIVYIFGSCLA